MKKNIIFIILLLAFPAFGQGTLNDLPTPIMNCFEADHGLYLSISQDQFGDLSAQLSEVSFVEEVQLALFLNVDVKVYTDTFVPTEAYGALDLDSGNMFHLGITDPSGVGRFSGEVKFVIDGAFSKRAVHCRKTQ